MIDVVIPYVRNRFWPEKLKYALRSFHRNFKEDFRIHIVGYLPDWCRNVEHYPFEDDLQNPKENKLGQKLKIVMERLPRFIWTYDDIYLLQPVSLQDLLVPRVNEYLGIFSKEQRLTGPFGDKLWRTYDRCLELGLSGFSFQRHLPYFFESNKLARVYELFNIEEGEHFAQTAYFNMFFPGEENLVWDHEKVVFYNKDDFARNPDFGNAKFLNHNDRGCTKDLQQRIHKLFPEKSAFEK